MADASLTACIFNIQKFSLHDGPGIRTTVFFKGCPLRCRWCANPESIRHGVQAMWDERKCVACGQCADACPEKAVGISQKTVAVAFDRCTGCGACVRQCPAGALTLSGRDYTVDEVVTACLADRDFYQESGGGVTLSGGEVTAQHRFAETLIDRLHKEKIAVALETNGFAKPEVFTRLAEKADLLLVDVKHYDNDRHRMGTGVGNAEIVANIRRALAMQKDVLPRIAVIPSFNDQPEDAEGFGELLRNLGLRKAQLLPFHQLGEGKYTMLAMPYQLRNKQALEKTDLAEFKNILEKYSLEVIL